MKPVKDDEAKRQILKKIKNLLKESGKALSREDFKAIARRCTERMFKHFAVKQKTKPNLQPREFLSSRRTIKVQALINKYIEQIK